MPGPGTAAWEEAVASVPASVVVYFTLELQHPGFLDETGENQIPIRLVTGAREAMQLGIEDGAAFNGGEMATFAAIPFQAEYPEFAEGRVPEARIAIDNVARELLPHIERAMTYRADLIAIYREYRSDDPTSPCYGPVEFVIRNASMTGTRIEGIARLDNLASRKFPSKLYTLRDFPGLQP
jgi:hypothetical protein